MSETPDQINTGDHEYHMDLALKQAQKALAAGEFPVGCLLVGNDGIVATGRRTHSLGRTANELDHAEIVALRALLAEHPDIDRSTITAYATMEPCLMCYASLILNGIHKIVYAYEDAMGGGTSIDLTALSPLYREMRVTVIPYIRRRESLALFKLFFDDPCNDYWRDSQLARYTLDQP